MLFKMFAFQSVQSLLQQKRITTLPEIKDSQWKQVFLGQLQVIIITKPAEHSPCGLMPSSLDKQSVQEQETWKKKNMKPLMHLWSFIA